MNAIQHRKESEEKRIMNLFRSKYQDFPSGKLIKAESPDFLLKVTISRTIGIEIASIGLGVFVDDKPFDEILMRILHQKEEKLKIYRRKKLSFYWLIIYFELGQFKIGNKLKDRLLSLYPESGFHRIFLFDSMKGKIYDLK